MTNKNKKRGTRTEQYVVNFLKKQGYKAFRIPSSGSGTKEYAPDVFAGYAGNPVVSAHRFLIEVKLTKKDVKYISKATLADLICLSIHFDAIPVVCINFNRDYRWYNASRAFVDCKLTNNSVRFEKEKILTFDEFRKKEVRE